MIAIVMGKMTVRRVLARCRFSNWPPQIHFIAGGKAACRAESLLRLRDKAALVASADVGAHSDLPPVFAPRDDGGAVDDADLRQLRERHAPAFVRRHQHVADGGARWRAPREYIEP